jgi:hypothetical protein
MIFLISRQWHDREETGEGTMGNREDVPVYFANRLKTGGGSKLFVQIQSMFKISKTIDIGG